MSDKEESAWREYIQNTNYCSSSTSSSNTIMNSNESVNEVYNSQIQNIINNSHNHHDHDSSANPMTDPFSLDRNDCQRPSQVEYLSSFFPLQANLDHGGGRAMKYDMTSFPQCPSSDLLDNNNSNSNIVTDDAQFVDDQVHVIARLQHLMDSRKENYLVNDRFRIASPHASTRRIVNPSDNCCNNIELSQPASEQINVGMDINNYEGQLPVDSGSEDDSLDQYLKSYRQQQQQNIDTVGPSTSNCSTFNLDDEFRDFKSDLIFAPFSSIGTLYTSNSSIVSSTAKALRTNLTRLDSGLSRCEEKAEAVQQMLEQLQGTLRISSFNNPCFDQQQEQQSRVMEGHPTSSPIIEDRPLTYTIDTEYAQWEAQTTMSNETYLNFAFEYDSADELTNVAIDHSQSEPPLSFHQDSSSSHNHHRNIDIFSNQTTLGRQDPTTNNNSRDMSPATRQFHISIGYPVHDHDQATDSNCIMIPDNPRSFPRNLIGDETPVPLFDGSNEPESEARNVNATQIPDSGVGSESSDDSENLEHDGFEMEECQGTSQAITTNEDNANVVTGKTTQIQPKFNLIDIENVSDTLWEQGVIPPAIDTSDLETELKNNVSQQSCSKFSDEDIAKIQKMVTEELKRTCSLSWDNESLEEENCECEEKFLKSQYSDSEVKSEKSDDDEVNEIESSEDIEIQEESLVTGGGDTRSISQVSQVSQSLTLKDEGQSESSGSSQHHLNDNGEIENGTGDGDTAYLEYSPSKISGFKAGLKNLKTKMCRCTCRKIDINRKDD